MNFVKWGGIIFLLPRAANMGFEERKTMMSELTSMRNIGKEMEKKLKSVGVGSAEELVQMGSKEAFFRLKMRYPNVCLVHLYTLQGAIDHIEYNQLPSEVKDDLKIFSDNLK